MVRPRTMREPRGAWQYLWREGLGARNQHGQHSDDDHPHETVATGALRACAMVRSSARAWWVVWPIAWSVRQTPQICRCKFIGTHAALVHSHWVRETTLSSRRGPRLVLHGAERGLSRCPARRCGAPGP
jgi:hypothetical protein